MATNYVSLAISDTMFPEGSFQKQSLSPEAAKDFIKSHSVVSAANPTHAATFDVLNRKFGIDLPVPNEAPKIALVPGDQVLVFQANLPRFTGTPHSDEVVQKAEFKFSLWKIL